MGLPTSGTGHLFGNTGRHQDLPASDPMSLASEITL